jgi:hypothetical protein
MAGSIHQIAPEVGLILFSGSVYEDDVSPAENMRLAQANFAFHACASAFVLTVLYGECHQGVDLPGTLFVLGGLIVWATLRAWRHLATFDEAI